MHRHLYRQTCVQTDMCTDRHVYDHLDEVPAPDDETALLRARIADLEAKNARQARMLQSLPEGEEVQGQPVRDRPRGLSLHAIEKEDVTFLNEAPIGEGRDIRRVYIGSISASPTACLLRGYGCAGTQNDRHSEAAILSTGTSMPVQWACRRRCRYRAHGFTAIEQEAVTFPKRGSCRPYHRQSQAVRGRGPKP